LVLLAHLLLSWWLSGLQWLGPGPQSPTALEVRLVPPALTAPAKPTPRPPPSPKPSKAEPVPVAASPATPAVDQATAQAPESRPAGDPLGPGGLSRAEAQRLERPTDLMPQQGAMPLLAYWGRYDQGGSLLGRGELSLTYPTPAQYRVQLRAEALGWLALLVRGEVSLVSEGLLSPSGLSPLRFEQVTPRRGRLESRFDPAARQAMLRPNQDPVLMPLGTQDRLSVVFHLAWLGEAQPGGLRPGQRFDVPMATLSEVRTLTFHATDREELAFPGGIVVTALRLVSDPIQFRRLGQIQIWLDQADRHMPARILYTEPDGRALDFLAVRAPQ